MLAAPGGTASVSRMNSRQLARRIKVAAALLSTAAVTIGVAVAPAQTSRSAAKTITPAGVGAVKLGKTYRQLRHENLIGHARKGCELGGPNTRFAPLRPPLAGTVDLTLYSPRKVANIAIRGGAKARGVGIGDTIADIRKAYPKARVDRGTEETFGITLVKIPRDGGGRLQFAVSTKTRKITLIGIPFIAFCE